MVLMAGATAGIVNPVNPLLAPEHIAGILRDTRREGRGDAGGVPPDRSRPEGRRGGGARPGRGDGAAGRPGALPGAAARLDRAAAAAEARAGAPGADARPPRRAPARARRRADLRRGARRPDLRLFPHRRHHRPAQGRPAPGERHPLQRLVRQVLHVHRGGRADVPAADVPRLRGLPGADLLPDVRRAHGDADAAGLSRPGGDRRTSGS